MKKQQVGLIGLAVMGKNLALNIASRGFTIAVFNRSGDRTRSFEEEAADVEGLKAFYDLKGFVDSLEVPRRIILMVKAGAPVDGTIEQLIPLLDQGDMIIDGGNSYYQDTIRRSKALEARGLYFIGAGVSGGEEGALKGPAIMPGGSEAAYRLIEPVLTAISAKVEGTPCCTYIGPDGAGHFVKMVHNGIEYGDMQLICEAYNLLRQVLGLSASALHQVFDTWNQGELNSYLIDITADIFKKTDEVTGKPMVDVILDTAGEKGTGKWTSQSALEMGVPTPTITEAVFARYVSALKKERTAAAGILTGPDGSGSVMEQEAFVEAVRRALFASKICSYAQGFSLMQAASDKFGWDLKPGSIAMIFRGGCIIRAQFLFRIDEAYKKEPGLRNLLLDDYFRNVLTEYQAAWREVIQTGVAYGIPMPAFTSALAYYDSYRSERLPANLLQAQRDYFGAHTYERVDQPGVFHTQW